MNIFIELPEVATRHPVWPLIGPTIAIGAVMLLPGLFGTGRPAMRWISKHSVSFWIFSWFLVASVTLTIIGVYFRGPGWAFTLPWRDGVF